MSGDIPMDSQSDLFNTQSQDTEMSDINQVDPQSGLQSSEIERSLSYSEMSSLEPTGVVMRPGVNDDQGTSVGMNSEIGHTDLAIGRIYATDMDRGRFMEKFKEFILNFKTECPDENFKTDLEFDPLQPLYLQKLREMSLLRVNWLHISCRHLKEYSSELCYDIITYPKEVIPAMDSVVDLLFKSLYRDINLPMIQTRPYNCEQSRNLRNLNPEDLDQLVTVNGLVIRLSGIIPEMTKAHFKCSICNFITHVLCERGRFLEPDYCSNCHANHTQIIIHNLCEFSDKQLIKLQESPEEMPAGQTPHTVNLYAHADLVDKVQPGDRVTITGIYRSISQRESSRMRTIKSVFTTYIDVLHFQKAANRLRDDTDKALLSSERIEEIKKLSQTPDYYERLSTAIAPSIYGNTDIKKGILLQLFGGTSKDLKSVGGSGDTRGNVHILLCGDPATAKSQLLQYVFNLTPRSQYISGKGSSEVGLTTYVTRDLQTNHLNLETGTLVLTDNRMCGIDEIDQISDSIRLVLYEVMDQQSLGTDNAGVNSKRNARTSVLAAANPMGSSWDLTKTIIANTQLPPALVSRFDLIFEILDTKAPLDQLADIEIGGNGDGSISMDLLRDYVSYARENIEPQLKKKTRLSLKELYMSRRKYGCGPYKSKLEYASMFESLVRLSEAHARMRLSPIVTSEDWLEAYRLQRKMLQKEDVPFDCHAARILSWTLPLPPEQTYFDPARIRSMYILKDELRISRAQLGRRNIGKDDFDQWNALNDRILSDFEYTLNWLVRNFYGYIEANVSIYVNILEQEVWANLFKDSYQFNIDNLLPSFRISSLADDEYYHLCNDRNRHLINLRM